MRGADRGFAAGNVTSRARDDLQRILADVFASKGGSALLLGLRADWVEHFTALEELGGGAADGGLVVHDLPGYLATPRPRRKFSVGILACDAPDLARAPFAQLLSRLRDLDCERVYLYCPGRVVVEDDRLVRALGLRLLRTYPDEGAAGEGGRLYYFDIFDYKDAPEWLSSRFWANPQMWDKARW